VSSDRALSTEYVLIIGTKDWFDCFEKKQKPGTGLGAACEADDLRHRIYEAGGVIGNIRVVLFDDTDAEHIPGKLKRYHRFHAERDFADIVRWLGGTLRGKYARKSVVPSHKKRSDPLKSENPFKTAGALPYDHHTYIRRVSDGELERIVVRADRLVSISGEFGIGKSSLMQQTRRLLTGHQFFGGGLADLGGHDERLFMKNFFRLFARRFGLISEWDELEENVNRCPSVLFLDDIGEVAAPGLSALIPALLARLTEQHLNLRVIATSSEPLRAVFNDRELRNPRYSKPWTQITVANCNNEEARQLLQKLPGRSQAIAMDHLTKIERMSRFAPQRLQCLCSRLFNGECDGLLDRELLNLVEDSASYE
jgi:hypothetical protein